MDVQNSIEKTYKPSILNAEMLTITFGGLAIILAIEFYADKIRDPYGLTYVAGIWFVAIYVFFFSSWFGIRIDQSTIFIRREGWLMFPVSISKTLTIKISDVVEIRSENGGRRFVFIDKNSKEFFARVWYMSKEQKFDFLKEILTKNQDIKLDNELQKYLGSQEV